MSTQTMSRREFLKASGIAAGAATLAATTAGCGGQPSAGPSTQPKKEVDTPSYSYGEGESTNPRILVAYATRTGSTVGVAAAIGETLAARGYHVDVKPIQENPSPEGYQAVVLGSAVNGGKWLPEAVTYVQDHQQALGRTMLALFCVHIMNLGDDEKAKKNRLTYLDNVRALVRPDAEAFFAGVGMNADEVSAVVRWAYRTFKIGGEGDCRDWTKIRGWAQTVALPQP